MNRSNTEKLYADFPRLYREASNKKSMMQYGFETNDGWFNLIYKLSADIEAEADRMGLDPESKEWPCAIQVKEKFGTLKFYCAVGQKKEKLQPEASGPLLCFRPLPDNKTIRALIMQAEKESATICEVCGGPSELRREGWWRVTCDKCETERQARGGVVMVQSTQMENKKDPMQEVLAAIGAWTMHNSQGKPEMAKQIFDCVYPEFRGRYPHHKLLTHLCQEASPPLLVTPDASLLTVYIVADRLSVRLPSGEVLYHHDPIVLADMLFARGYAPDDVACADWREGDRAPMAGQAVALKARLRELSNAKACDANSLF